MSSPPESDRDSEDEEHISFFYYFPSDDNNNPLVSAVARVDDNRIFELLYVDKEPIIPRALLALLYTGNFTFLDLFLERGASPNVRLDENMEVSPGWDQRDIEVEFRRADHSPGLYPLTVATHPVQRLPWEGKSEQLDSMRLLLQYGADPYAVYRHELGPGAMYPFPGQDFDDALDPPSYPGGPTRQFGVRSVVHALIEEGELVLPFFDEQVNLDLEHRDPQGRTILHSICRSSRGADAGLGPERTGIGKSKVSPGIASMFHTARLRNADVRAVDNDRKHILYHLLAATRGHYEQPEIEDAFNWTLLNCPELVNRPDRFGTYPLHVALRRLRLRSRPLEGAVDNLKSVIERLLEAGGDPAARDSRGNTALHYLADCGLFDAGDGERARCLFRRFLDLGLDINARNNAGMSVAFMIFSARDSRVVHVSWAHVPSEEFYEPVLEWMDRAGARWTDTVDGQTLFSALAKGEPRHQEALATYLISKGVNPYVKRKDKERDDQTS